MKKEWWQEKVAYQIYPKSFKDTKGNGIGDIKGIIEKLDYLKELGIDIIWISPCFLSPLADQGYDIADYYKIDPRFGSNEDMEELISEAKKRDMYILLDLVVNHCSDEHEWFRKAVADPKGSFAKYFYFEEGVDGHEPNNWRSYFGGSVWEKVEGTENTYYLHLFHKKQPDLNWENPELREEIYKMINWWLDKGIAGFRIDAILNIKKVFPLRGHDFPVDRDDGLSNCTRMITEAEGIGDFLGEMRDRCFKPHHAFSVGEVFNETEAQIPEFIGENGYFSSMFDFRAHSSARSELGWYDAGIVTPNMYRDACFLTQKLVNPVGFISTIIENHDEPRGVSFYIPKEDLSEKAKKFLATMQMLQRGLPFIYQGQEIGMENVVLTSIREVDDISTLDEYEVCLREGFSEEEALRIVNRYSRDNARTPVQWDSSKNAGFTTGTPWLPLNPNYKKINVAQQEKDPESVLSYYKKLTALRKNPEYKETMVYGDFVPFMADEDRLMAFYRKGEKTLLILGNYRKEERELELPAPVKKLVLSNTEPRITGRKIVLSGYEATILEV
ncbi:alpha-glucosidase [Oribacterium sp. oral taxon 108]|uniref:alpha-glucosidase n=1 Tax=Oribacterium sp. oral taxon 108 TaxID=712414 RepID=UPI00020DD787|nr:alpha-glucosidase [Oribacterium sp. oral taxon 108]EGL37403.1 alpha amylase, catalytic domain protein [Oribacterium sp. oral taxon 108 str. F0425]